MDQNVPAFTIKKDGKILDYRQGIDRDISEIVSFFASKGYEVGNLVFEGRHIVGIVKKNGEEQFLKLATTEGMSIMTAIEYDWNKQFQFLSPRSVSKVWVPAPVESGYYQKALFYHVCDLFSGTPLATSRDGFTASPMLQNKLETIIDVSEHISNLPFQPFTRNWEIDEVDHRTWFVKKTALWLESIPAYIVENYELSHLFRRVEEGVSDLEPRARHGDFTPWHMILLQNRKLGLLDAEHAMTNGVEYYDIAYFIQRVYSVLKSTALAETVVEHLRERNYNVRKLQTVLLARAIGGFLDESLSPKPDYATAQSFVEWTQQLSKD